MMEWSEFWPYWLQGTLSLMTLGAIWQMFFAKEDKADK